MTCFTCEKSRSNEECNRQAIDETCEQKLANSHSNALLTMKSSINMNTNYSCMTVHRFDAVAKKTISVEKKCSNDCRPDMIGCVAEVSSQPGGINQQIQVILNFFK